MTETKKKKLLIGLIAAVLIVVFFFAGFGAGYGTGKGADPAPDADNAPGSGLYVENSSSDGLKIATLSATRTASSADPYGFDYFNSPFRYEDREEYYTSFICEGSLTFPFDSYTFLEVAYSDGTPIESSATIEWTLTCEDAYWDYAGGNWKNTWTTFPRWSSEPVDSLFLDLAIYEDEAHARLGCKMPFFFPVTLGVEVTTKEKKSYTADLSIGYRKSRAERSALELYFNGISDSVSTWGYSGGHDEDLDIDYLALRIPIYSYAVVTGTDTKSFGTYGWEMEPYRDPDMSGGFRDIATAYLDSFDVGFVDRGLILADSKLDVYRLGFGLRWVAAEYYQYGYIADPDGTHSDLNDCCGCLTSEFDFFGQDPNELALWTDDPDIETVDYVPCEFYPEMSNFEVMLGSAFKDGGLYAEIGDPYANLLTFCEEVLDEEFDFGCFVHTGPGAACFNTSMETFKGYFSGRSELDDAEQSPGWSLTDFCLWPGAIRGTEDYDTAMACIKEGAKKYLEDPASYKWEPTYYIRTGDGGWLGVGLDFSGGPNGYRGISA